MLNILEAGCGKGRHTDYLRTKYKDANVYGCDISEESISYAKQHYPQVNFATMYMENLTYADRFFDKIYALDVLEHVDELEKSVQELARVIKPGGEMTVTVPAEKSEQWLTSIRPSYPHEMHHVRVYKGTEMEDLMNRMGFSLRKKTLEGFSDHLILYYLFKTSQGKPANQLGIGNWRDTLMGRILFSIHLFSKPNLVFESWLKFIPLWVIGITIGKIVNYFGNKYMPKSCCYVFEKR